MGRQVEFNAFMEVAIDYILEELAAAVQLQKCGADFFTYPGSMNPPACYLVKHFPRETALKYIVYKPQECERSNEDKPQTIASLFFPSQPQSQSQHVSIQYAQWLLDRANWNKKQKEQFIHGLNQLLTTINASTQPTEPVSSINKPIARRASI